MAAAVAKFTAAFFGTRSGYLGGEAVGIGSSCSDVVRGGIRGGERVDPARRFTTGSTVPGGEICTIVVRIAVSNSRISSGSIARDCPPTACIAVSVSFRGDLRDRLATNPQPPRDTPGKTSGEIEEGH
eukprot:m.230658 g.230658  ORF g.230658 m.230658 type:complete len:128 (+) comp26030_c0_seq10:4503-4886(+)